MMRALTIVMALLIAATGFAQAAPKENRTEQRTHKIPAPAKQAKRKDRRFNDIA